MSSSDSGREEAPAPPDAELGWRKRLLFWGLLVALVLGSVELTTRVYFASRIGLSVLFYGTPFERVAVDGSQEHSALARNLRRRRLMGVGDRNHSVRHPDEQRVGYYKYHPGQDRSTYDVDTGEVYTVHINSRGFRGPEWSDEKPAGTTRVVTLGASSTFGYHDRDDLTYPAQLQRDLDERCPRARYEVINLGIPHLLTPEIVALFRAEGLGLDPDVVTFYEGYNDSSNVDDADGAEAAPGSGTPRPGRRPLKRVLRFSRDHLLLVALGDALVSDWTKRYEPPFVAEHIERRRREFLEKLSELRDLSREFGFQLMVVSQQARSLDVMREDLHGMRYGDEVAIVSQALARKGWLGRKELAFLTHASLMEAEETWAHEQGVPFVDVLRALDTRREVVVSWVHLNHEGNAVVADLLAEAILPRTCPEPSHPEAAG